MRAGRTGVGSCYASAACSMQFGCAWRQAGATISKECPVAAVISFEHRLHRSGGPREQGTTICETAGFAHSIPCRTACQHVCAFNKNLWNPWLMLSAKPEQTNLVKRKLMQSCMHANAKCASHFGSCHQIDNLNFAEHMAHGASPK